MRLCGTAVKSSCTAQKTSPFMMSLCISFYLFIHSLFQTLLWIHLPASFVWFPQLPFCSKVNPSCWIKSFNTNWNGLISRFQLSANRTLVNVSNIIYLLYINYSLEINVKSWAISFELAFEFSPVSSFGMPSFNSSSDIVQLISPSMLTNLLQQYNFFKKQTISLSKKCWACLCLSLTWFVGSFTWKVHCMS